MLRLRLALLALILPLTAHAAIVTTGADSGPGSLRQAILDANANACGLPCTISFALPSGERPKLVITLLSELPALTAHHVTISPRAVGESFPLGPPVEVLGGLAGTADGFRIVATHDVMLFGLAFRGFSNNGVVVYASSNVILGASVLDNGENGFVVAESRNVQLSGCTAGRNRRDGAFITRSTKLMVLSCNIGSNGNNDALGNGGNGFHLHDTHGAAFGSTIIRRNGADGIVVTGDSSGNDFESALFGGNGGLGIDIGADGPTPAGAPVLESARYNRGWLRAKGHVSGTPGGTIRVLLYVVNDPDPSGYGEGNDHLPLDAYKEMEVVADSGGRAAFTFDVRDVPWRPVRGMRVTALATAGDSSSEFARNVPVVDDQVEFAVTTMADDGAGSLRDAIRQANEGECAKSFACVIAFHLAGGDQNGVFTIQPRSPLPAITRSGIWIDGATQRAFAGDTNPRGPEIELNGALCGDCNGLEVRGGAAGVESIVVHELAINGFRGHGFYVLGNPLAFSALGRIDGCFIGTDASGTRAVPNGGDGVRVENGAFEVGSVPDSRLLFAPEPKGCVISGNAGNGVSGAGGAGGSIFLTRNVIGADLGGLAALPNGRNGVDVAALSDIVSNTIAFNRDRGVVVRPQPQRPIAVLTNQIHSNGSLGIDLRGDGVTENDPGDKDGLQNAPVITSARSDGASTVVTMSLDSPKRNTPTDYLVEVFAGAFADGSGHGEGRRPVASTFATGGGVPATFEVTVKENLAGKFVSATATAWDGFAWFAAGTTSELSTAVQVSSDTCGNLAPSLEAPAAGAELDRETTFRWSAVPGASVYILWTMRPGDAPRATQQTTATETTVTLDPGPLEWWVEARQDPCYGTQSAHRFGRGSGL